ncbi:head GIN domain-containing protein, partial [Chloroflexota bacterium]
IVRIDDNLLKYLEVVKEGDTLKIGLKTNQRVKDGTFEAEVTLPELTGLKLSGASQAATAGFKAANALNVDVSGASHLRGDIEAGDARFDVSGGGNVILRGSAGDLSVDASGASNVDLADLSVDNANIKASEASRVTVNASGTLDVDARGASRVYYLGSPVLGTTNLEGASTIEQK